MSRTRARLRAAELLSGCAECTGRWGKFDPNQAALVEIGRDETGWLSLHRCRTCGVFWECDNHDFYLLSAADAMQDFPNLAIWGDAARPVEEPRRATWLDRIQGWLGRRR